MPIGVEVWFTNQIRLPFFFEKRFVRVSSRFFLVTLSIERYFSILYSTSNPNFTLNNRGYITGYTGTDSTVVIPQYWQSDNGDGTYSAIKVRGIAANYEDNNGELVVLSLLPIRQTRPWSTHYPKINKEIPVVNAGLSKFCYKNYSLYKLPCIHSILIILN